MRTKGGEDCCQRFDTLSRTMASIFIYILKNMQFLCPNPISVSVSYNKMNRRLL
jgi:hypothetical protein